MPFEIQTVSNALILPGNQAKFQFSDSIAFWTVGISSFNLTFGENTQHHIQQISIALQSPSMSGSELTVTVEAILTDKHNRSIYVNPGDPNTSYVALTALAYTGSSTNSGMALVSPVSWSLAKSPDSEATSYPGSGLSGQIYASQVGLAGFDVACPPGQDNQVNTVSASVGINWTTDSQIEFSGAANLSPGQLYTSTVAAGALVSATTDPNAFAFSSVVATETTNQQTIPMQNALGKPLTRALNPNQIGAMLTGFTLNYPSGSDHYVSRIGAGPTSVTVDPNNNKQVVANEIMAWMNDTSCNVQDWVNSSCSIVVFGLAK